VTRAAVVAAVLLAAAPAAAQSADEHARLAEQYYQVGNFEGALAEFRAAYQLDPKVDYLFAMATIEEQRGGCAAAIELYEQFLATAPPEEDAAVAHAAIDKCKETLGITDQPPPPVDDEPRPPPAEEPPPAPRRITRPFYTDLLGDALVGAGALGLAAGGALYLLARGDADAAAEVGISHDEYQARWQEAQDRRRLALIAAGVGGALVVGGVVRWITGDRTEEVPAVAIAPAELGHGVLVTLTAPARRRSARPR
jgi:tetratricopeptide (TPR) repeat protein